jgi:hypothetical protein
MARHCLSPLALWLPLHDARPAANHEAAGGHLVGRDLERGAGQGASCRLPAFLPVSVPLPDVEAEAGSKWFSCVLTCLLSFLGTNIIYLILL